MRKFVDRVGTAFERDLTEVALDDSVEPLDV
jgi:hypothetical protein